MSQKMLSVLNQNEFKSSIADWLYSSEDQPPRTSPDPDLDQSRFFIPIPYGIKVDPSKAEVVIRNGVMGIVVNPTTEGEY